MNLTITPYQILALDDSESFIRELEKRSMSSWSAEEMARYNELTGQSEPADEQHSGSTISSLVGAVERAEQKAIVACGCGQELPKTEALTHEDMPGSFFCSEECRNDAEQNAIAGEIAGRRNC